MTSTQDTGGDPASWPWEDAPAYIDMDTGAADDVHRDIMGAVGAARYGHRTVIRWEGRAFAAVAPVADSPGAETLVVTVKFSHRNEVLPLATDRARELYGDGAPVEIVRIGKVTSIGGSFRCDVIVRCDDLPPALIP